MARLEELFDIRGKTAIVTGGGSGIGRYLAEGLAEAGCNVALCARNVDRCDETAAALADAYGIGSLACACDVRDATAVQAVVDETHRRFGAVDILVNNAGTSWGAPAEDYPLDGWRKVIDVNLTGVFLFAQAAGRLMIRQSGGKIVNISSVAAFGGADPAIMDAVGYNASKGGVISLTRDLAVKWARHGINVNAIAPGWFPSEMTSVLLERSGPRFLERIPLGRFGQGDDLKGAILFLASPASSFITGHTLVVDGGQLVA